MPIEKTPASQILALALLLLVGAVGCGKPDQPALHRAVLDDDLKAVQQRLRDGDDVCCLPDSRRTGRAAER